MRRVLLVLLSVLALALAPVTVATAAPVATAAAAKPRLGAPGIGDPYFPTDGNGGYQVTSYDLRIRYSPRTDRLSGTATLRARATQTLARFNLDLDGLSVDRVYVNHRRARWSRAADELRIRPKHTLRKNHGFVVKIKYHGKPKFYDEGELGKNGVIPTNDGAIAVGQPHVADNWFPANDHPLDKATYRIRITVPRDVAAISNGALRSLRAKGGLRTWTWDMTKPMASYLAIMAIGRFDIRSSTKAGVKYVSAIDPALKTIKSKSEVTPDPTIGERAENALAAQPEVLGFLSRVLGRYPFAQAGGIVDNDPKIGYALENQTRPIYDKRFFTGGDPRTDDSVVVHELAHQWVGDSVALSRWRDIWLNEGFASYMEWLWSEHQGRGTADEIFADYNAEYPASDPFWKVRIGDPGPANIFDGAVYNRGAMTLHALRREIGDATFFALLKRWTTSHAQGNATLRQFIDLAERMSKRDLDPFFRVWLFTPRKPASLESATARTSFRTKGLARQLIARHERLGRH